MKRPLVILGIALGVMVVGILAVRPKATSLVSGSTATPKATAKSTVTGASPNATPPTPVPAATPPMADDKNSPPATPGPPEGASHRPVVPRPEPPDSPAKVAINAVALNLRNYGFRFGGNPTGSNAEITKTLNGDNPAHAKYLPAEHTNISPQGELLDYWGTPYFFHQQSATETVIRSAGPDKKLYTVDDITTK